MQACPRRTFERRNEAETLGAWPCGLAGRAAMGAAGRGPTVWWTPDSYLPARQAILLDWCVRCSPAHTQSSRAVAVISRQRTATFLAQAVLAWPFVHGRLIEQCAVGPAHGEKGIFVVIRHSLVRTYFKVIERSLIRPTRRLDRVTGG